MSMVDRKSSANPLTHEHQSIVPAAASSNAVSDPLAQYGCGPIEFSGTDDTFYERRLILDKVIDPSAATLREHAKGKQRISTDASAYSFRHARISELLQIYGIDPITVAAQTGTSVAMIEKAYLRFIPSAMQEKLAALKG
jgi:integrase